MRVCPSCNIAKNLADYGIDRNRKDGKNCYCKECVRLKHYSRPKRVKQYDPVKAKLYKNNRNKEQRDLQATAKRDSMLKIRYGVSREQYADMFAAQNGACAICRRHQSTMKTALAVDHNHLTKKVRGLLCSNCNRILGFLKVDGTDDLVENLAKYPKGR